MTLNLRVLSLLIGWLGLAMAPLVTACQSSARADDPEPLALADVLAGPNQPIESIPVGARLHAPAPATYTYQQIEGAPEPRAVERRYEPAIRDGNAWVERTPAFNLAKHYQRGADGTIRLLAVDDLDRQVRSRFDGGLVVYVPGMGGEPIETQADVTVTGLDDPNDPVDRGRATMRVSCHARRTVHAPAGRYDAYHIVTDFHARFGMAQVTSHTDTYRAPGRGVVLERYTEKGVALIVPWNKSYTIVLTRHDSEL